MKGFAGIAKPMTNLMRKDKDFTWGTEEEATFNKLKEALTSAPVLQVFNEDKQHEVWVDASDYGNGATLVQQDDDSKRWLPVEYLSHRLSVVE